MEGPAKQGGSDGYGRRGGDLPGRSMEKGTERRVNGKSGGSWQQKGRPERGDKREGEPGIERSFWDTWQKGLSWGYQGPGVLPVGPRPLPGQDSVAKG